MKMPAQPGLLALVSNAPQQPARTFSQATQQKLAKSNCMLRWLRERGATAVAVDLSGDVPAITVPGAAAPMLKSEAFRHSHRRLRDGRGTEMVVIDDCIVQWRDKE